MPWYQYECACGAQMSEFTSIERRKQKLRCRKCGELASRNIAAEQAGIQVKDRLWNDHRSLALAVPVEDVKKWEQVDRENGVYRKDRYVPDGEGMARPSFSSMLDRRKYVNRHGYKDKDSFI